MRLDVDDVTFDIDMVTLCGRIIHKLAWNVLKRAFGDGGSEFERAWRLWEMASCPRALTTAPASWATQTAAVLNLSV